MLDQHLLQPPADVRNAQTATAEATFDEAVSKAIRYWSVTCATASKQLQKSVAYAGGGEAAYMLRSTSLLASQNSPAPQTWELPIRWQPDC